MPSNDLIDRYLQAVGFWLPRATRHDILAEISEDLHSQIEDREASLNRPLNEAEISDILKQRGRPVVVASAYLPRQSLIGPVFFPSYKLALKVTFLCYVIPWLLIWMGFLAFAPAKLGAPSVSALFSSLLPLWHISLIILVIITLVFHALDRGWSKARFANDWDPKRLPKIQTAQPRRRAEDIGGIVFGVLALIWLLAVPNFPFLILGPGALFVKFAPIWRTTYPLMLIASVVAIAEPVVNLLRSLPAWSQPIIKIVVLCLQLSVVLVLLSSRTFVQSQGLPSAQWLLITNQVVYICLVCAAVGQFIAIVVQAWKTYRAIERPSRPAVTHLA